jgi:hypothetical protein
VTVLQPLASWAPSTAVSRTIVNLLLTLVTIVVAGAFLYESYQRRPEFMLAQISLPCEEADFTKFPQVAVVVSGEPVNVAEVRKRLEQVKSVKIAKEEDEVFKSFLDLRKLGKDQIISDHLEKFVGATSPRPRWLVYTVDKPERAEDGPTIQVPLIFSDPRMTQNMTEIFVVGPTYFASPDQTGEVSSLTKRLRPRLLVEATFNPDAPKSSVQNTQLKVTFLAQTVCNFKTEP